MPPSSMTADRHAQRRNPRAGPRGPRPTTHAFTHVNDHASDVIDADASTVLAGLLCPAIAGISRWPRRAIYGARAVDHVHGEASR
jgi:hypothetical protein